MKRISDQHPKLHAEERSDNKKPELKRGSTKLTRVFIIENLHSLWAVGEMKTCSTCAGNIKCTAM
jgi:hypothetical protein